MEIDVTIPRISRKRTIYIIDKLGSQERTGTSGDPSEHGRKIF